MKQIARHQWSPLVAWSHSTGEVQLVSDAARRLMREVRSPDQQAVPLSKRETKPCACWRRAMPTERLRCDLGNGEQMVKTGVSSILGKLGVHSRTRGRVQPARAARLHLQAFGGEARVIGDAANVFGVGGAQLDPLLGWEVQVGQENVAILEQLVDGLWILGSMCNLEAVQ